MKRYSRMIMVAILSLSLVGVFALAGCSKPAAEEQKPAETPKTETHEPVTMQIFAANSLSKAMEAVQELYKQDHPWMTFADTQYKSSGELNEMLAAGSSADLLISASKAKMDEAAKAGYVDEATRFDMFKNDLVMVTSENNTDITACTLDDIAAGKYTVCVGDESVPAGNYACQSLNTVECYSDASGKGGSFAGALAEPGKVVVDTSVGNVCKHAQSGDVQIAFVYSSDVYRFGGVKVVGTVPNDTHKTIVYPAAVGKDSKVAADADAFLKWATTDEKAIKTWQEWGFELAS
ncbi:MAG: molybdate ABC transporter substrate-binding protein [Raoultibacter sp.]